MRRILRRAALLATVVAAAAGLAAGSASAAGPGGIFLTGHDPDFHVLLPSTNATGARHIIERAVGFVTNGNPNPTVLVVSSRIAPPAGHRDSVAGVKTVYPVVDVAAAPDQLQLDLNTVSFAAYDVVIIASDFGGILRQAELDILNARAADLASYLNNGGGIVAFAESGSGARLTTHGWFDWVPFLTTSVQLNQNEVGYTVTAFGASLGLVDADVNNNASHNVFTSTGGLNVVNIDGAGRIMSLAARGAQLCPGGFPSASISDVGTSEGNAGPTTFVFDVTLSVAPCAGPVTLDVATADGTAVAGSDYVAVPLTTLTFEPGETSKQVSVIVNGDTTFEPDETFLVELSNASGATITDAEGVGTILNDDPQNRPPSCENVAASQATLSPPNHKLVEVSLSGGSDPDGDAVSLAVTGVTQDEPVNAAGDGNRAPDAAAGSTANAVQLRAERSGKGDGRVYRIAFTGSDGRGASCSGTALVTVPHDRGGGSAAVDSGLTFDSFGT